MQVINVQIQKCWIRFNAFIYKIIFVFWFNIFVFVNYIFFHSIFFFFFFFFLLGYGGLSLFIVGPSKVDINTEDQEDGTCKVTYCPTEPGNYIINIKFADQHVPGIYYLLAVLYFQIASFS